MEKLLAGVDEVGRGCLAGPVFAAAVILPDNFRHPLIKDSKKLSPKKRDEAFEIIISNAISYGIASVSCEEIDAINILQATYKAMHLAIDNLDVKPSKLLIDGDRFDGYPGISHECIIKGDSKEITIAAASILAKATRDEFMSDLSKKFPQYLWEKNFGYGTADHMKALEVHGLTHWHRKTFCTRFL